MIRRSRTLVALLALVALSAFVAESAWALVCPPGMGACEAGTETCTSAPASSAESGEHAPVAHHTPPSPDGSESIPSHAPVCPMALASGGCAVAALPAIAVATQPLVVQQNVVLLSFDRTPDLLVVAGHFRPPRA